MAPAGKCRFDLLKFAEDRPGALANILRRISAEELNVISTYTLTRTRVAISVDRPQRLRDILSELAPLATRIR